MKKIAVIFLASYPIVKIIFHLMKYEPVEYVTIPDPDPNEFIYQLYFIYNGMAMVGFFAILHSISCYLHKNKSLYLKGSVISAISFKRYTLLLFIYSIWCFVVDILMSFGIGSKESVLYTGVSIILLAITILWSFVLKR